MSNGVKPNYFTCTLGQALIINQGEAQISNINDFIEHQASTVAEHPAVGFANIGQDKSACQRYSFRDVARGSIFVSQLAVKDIKNTTTQGQTTVALLCPSTPEFLFAWLGLMRLGHAVLLIAPQCQPSAIAHLCQTCDVGTLFFDDSYQELATSSSKAAQSEKDHKLECVPLMFSTTSKAFADALQSQPESITSPKLDDTAIGYLHHTSGTSTGLPKPIPQSHRAGLGVLPRFKDGTDKATFTTTPLYHGGVADLFRAWASNAMIWLFPGKGTPITAKNIVSCLDVACVEHERGQTPAVKYFSSVPYVLQMMAADSRGLSYLQKMDIVGVGGAALPAKAGDDLVEKGVNLISRFGSAECGFLMSSHRDYKNDKEWSYLRTGAGMDRVNFEEQDGGLAELVVLHGWPHKVSQHVDHRTMLPLTMQRQKRIVKTGHLPLLTSSSHTPRSLMLGNTTRVPTLS
jgi:acyl-CoA synthetase (AMP-forming)/AMP-acid ligase II